jgi:hypothetical protein
MKEFHMRLPLFNTVRNSNLYELIRMVNYATSEGAVCGYSGNPALVDRIPACQGIALPADIQGLSWVQ